MTPDDRGRIGHKIEAAEQALAFVRGRRREDLDADVLLQLALTLPWRCSRIRFLKSHKSASGLLSQPVLFCAGKMLRAR